MGGENTKTHKTKNLNEKIRKKHKNTKNTKTQPKNWTYKQKTQNT